MEFGDLSDVQIVLPSRPHVIRGVVELAAIHAGVPFEIALNCDSLPGIVQLVKSGYGTVFPSFAVSEEVSRGELVAIPVVEPTPRWRLSIVLSAKATNPRSSGAIAKLLDEVVRDLVRRGAWNAHVKRPVNAAVDPEP